LTYDVSDDCPDGALLDASLLSFSLSNGVITADQLADPDPSGYRVVGYLERFYYYLGQTNPSFIGQITSDGTAIPPVFYPTGSPSPYLGHNSAISAHN